MVGYKFKEARFTDLHRAALSYPSSSFAYIGTEMSSPGAEEGERRVMALFQEDPYGCQEPLSSKRAERDPFAEGGYSPDRCPDMASILLWCGPDLYTGSLPWDQQQAKGVLERTESEAFGA